MAQLVPAVQEISHRELASVARNLPFAAPPLDPEALRQSVRSSLLVSIITLRKRRIFQPADYHTLQLEEISLLVHF